MNGWIPVANPPKDEGEYLVSSGKDSPDFSVYANDEWENGYVWINSNDITHWMPLPQKPEKDGER